MREDDKKDKVDIGDMPNREDPTGDRWPTVLEMDIRRSYQHFGYSAHIIGADMQTGKPLYVASQITMQKAEKGAMMPAPLCLEDRAVQKLMDNLWEIGVRPSHQDKEKLTVHTLEATAEHIKDLRSERDFMRIQVAASQPVETAICPRQERDKQFALAKEEARERLQEMRKEKP